MNNNIIVQESAPVIRSIARSALKNNWFMVSLGVFLYFIMLISVPEILSALIPGASYTQYTEVLGQQTPQRISYITSLYTLIFSGAFQMGLCSFLIAFFRKKKVNPVYVFNGFEFFLKAFLLMLVYWIFVFLWSLLLVIPGIIASFRYSQAFFILVDDPKKGVMQCINESKFYMNGNKGSLFYLNLTFIGWGILTFVIIYIIAFAFVMIMALGGANLYDMQANGIEMSIISMLMYIPLSFLVAYILTANTVFYELVTGHLIAKPQSTMPNVSQQNVQQQSSQESITPVPQPVQPVVTDDNKSKISYPSTETLPPELQKVQPTEKEEVKEEKDDEITHTDIY